MTTRLEVRIERWPLAGRFVISRGAKTEAVVVVAELSLDGMLGRGECVPYPRYGQTPEETASLIAATGPSFDRRRLQQVMAPSAARNALDCALWDLAAKAEGTTVAALAGLPPPQPTTTCYTLSLDTPEAMAARAREHSGLPLLKLKLGGEADEQRMRLVRQARPDARLVADANEGWAERDLERLLAVAAECGFETIEQPLPADRDHALARIDRPLPVCADESAHALDGLELLCDRYDAVNVKLDKTGGLTEAMAMTTRARQLGLRVMIGSMVATSLSMAPAMLLAGQAEWVDLDSPLLLARDRVPGMQILDGMIQPASHELWG